MADAKVIVIEPSDLEAGSLQALLSFLDLESVHVHDLAELRQLSCGAALDGLAIIVGKEIVATVGPEFVTALRELARALPVIYLSNDGLPKIAESSGDVAWFQLELPVKQRRLSAVLNQARNVRSGHPTQPGAHRFRPSGTSRPMRDVHKLIEQVAPFDTNVLILGESGTGKEMVARHIHELSGRSGHPFVPVNCGAIPSELMESEFFGHKKGSFTGAHIDKDGLFQTANGGTLFLDEVAELPLHMQVKLLRVIQEKSVRPVGASTEVPVDVRILSATHKDLAQLVADNRFRHDLFYRLNVIELRVPALRERADDIPQLVEAILRRLSIDAGEQLPQLDADALQALRDYPFPGNVRELENILERATALCEGDAIHRADLRLPTAQAVPTTGAFAPSASLRVTGEHPVFRMPTGGNGDALPRHVEQLERDAIARALEECRYNKTKAAARLGITFRALRYKLKKLGME